MRHARPIPFSRPDATAVAVVAVLALGASSFVDCGESLRDWWMNRPPGDPASWPIAHREWSRWPYWLQAGWFSAVRLSSAAPPGLAVASLGLAIVAFRPRRGFRCGRLGRGHLASIIAAVLVVLGQFWLARWFWIDPPIRAWLGARPMPAQMPSLRVWDWLRWSIPTRTIARMIAVAWIMLLALGHRGGPIDGHDRLGRWLGWSWIAVVAWLWFFDFIQLS